MDDDWATPNCTQCLVPMQVVGTPKNPFWRCPECGIGSPGQPLPDWLRRPSTPVQTRHSSDPYPTDTLPAPSSTETRPR